VAGGMIVHLRSDCYFYDGLLRERRHLLRRCDQARPLLSCVSSRSTVQQGSATIRVQATCRITFLSAALRRPKGFPDLRRALELKRPCAPSSEPSKDTSDTSPKDNCVSTVSPEKSADCDRSRDELRLRTPSEVLGRTEARAWESRKGVGQR